MKTLATIIREAAPHTAKPAGADLLRREDVVAFIHKLRDLYEEEFALDEYSTAWGQCAAALEQGAVTPADMTTRDPGLYDPNRDGTRLASGDSIKIEAATNIVSLRVRDGLGVVSRIYLTRAEAREFLAPAKLGESS